MSQLPILLAAWGFGDLLLPAIVVIIWVVGQLVSSRQQEAAPQPRAVPDLLKPKQGDASQEIDEFLRQMAHRRGDQRPAQVEVVPPARLRSNPLAVEPVEVEIVKPQMTVDDGVAQHVRVHAFGDDIAKRVAHLGERVGLADEAMESHIEQTFDHKLGRLRDTSAAHHAPAAYAQHLPSPPSDEAAAAATSPTSRSRAGPSGLAAPDLAVLMRSPQDLRRAIVLYEILKRPES